MKSEMEGNEKSRIENDEYTKSAQNIEYSALWVSKEPNVREKERGKLAMVGE